jgi:hypothetical protein
MGRGVQGGADGTTCGLDAVTDGCLFLDRKDAEFQTEDDALTSHH